MNRAPRVGRYAVSVILWISASSSLGFGYTGSQFEPPGRVQTHTCQQMTKPGHLPGFKGALMDVLGWCLALPAPEGNLEKCWSASSPRGSGRAEGIYLENFTAWAFAGDEAEGPGRVQHWEEEATSRAGHRGPATYVPHWRSPA